MEQQRCALDVLADYSEDKNYFDRPAMERQLGAVCLAVDSSERPCAKWAELDEDGIITPHGDRICVKTNWNDLFMPDDEAPYTDFEAGDTSCQQESYLIE